MGDIDVESPFSPQMEGFQVILLAGAVESSSAVGILAALDEPDEESEADET